MLSGPGKHRYFQIFNPLRIWDQKPIVFSAKRSGIHIVALLTSFSFSSNLKADVMLGASLPNDGFSRHVISDFNSQSSKDLAFVNVYSAFSHDWDNLYWQSTNVFAEGAMPMISWMPIDLERREDNLLPEIAIGLWDEYLHTWGTQLLAWVNSYPENERPRLSIRFAHEFNGNWYPYSNSPEGFQAAWQHIHELFEQLGVNQHVDWIWSISKTSYDDYGDPSVYYPGDNYVDWTAIDGYNWGSNYSVNGWASFTEVFTNAYLDMISQYPTKPIMISETASAEPTDLPNPEYGMYGDDSDEFESKSLWISNMLRDIESDFPAIRAIALFNINKELSWSISEATNTGLDAWSVGVYSSHYTADYLIVDDALAEPSKGKGNGKTKTKPGKNRNQITTSQHRVMAASNTRKITRQSELAMSTTALKRSVGVLSKDLSDDAQRAFVRERLSIVDY